MPDLDLTNEPPVDTANAPPVVITPPFSLDQNREETRGDLARGLLYLLTFAIGGVLAFVGLGRLEGTVITQSVFPSLIALAGTALGFYFGSQSVKSSDTSNTVNGQSGTRPGGGQQAGQAGQPGPQVGHAGQVGQAGRPVQQDAQPPAGLGAPAERPMLRLGSKGELVKQMQAKVGVKGDGDFGPNTETAVRTFQKNHGLVPDGIVGPKTWAALNMVG
jgi:Putative peptidoglycan binding domain